MKDFLHSFPVFMMPWLLLLLVLLAGAGFFYWKRKAPSIRFPSVSGAGKIARKVFRFQYKKRIPQILILLAGVLMILALARPRKGLEQIRRRSEGVDIIIALDLSGSMGVYDAPQGIRGANQMADAINKGLVKNRLEIAKQEIAAFIEKRPADRIGLIVFAELPYMACPPTLDHGWLLANLKNLQPGVIGDKTGIAGPVASAVKRLKDSDAKRRIIVLFSDGVNNVSAKLPPRQTAKLANEFNVSIYTVGIGGKEAYAVVPSPYGNQLMQALSEFDGPLLRDMANITGGKYYHADDADSMAEAMSSIDALEKTTFEQQTLTNWRELAFPLITAAAVLLILAFALEQTIWIRVP